MQSYNIPWRTISLSAYDLCPMDNMGDQTTDEHCVSGGGLTVIPPHLPSTQPPGPR